MLTNFVISFSFDVSPSPFLGLNGLERCEWETEGGLNWGWVDDEIHLNSWNGWTFSS
jgi:hypothetical protein